VRFSYANRKGFIVLALALSRFLLIYTYFRTVEIDFGNEVKTIYWNYDESTVNIKWLDNETIEINDHKLNIFNDTYHWKKDPNWEENRGKY
jgi:hypothetical protein